MSAPTESEGKVGSVVLGMSRSGTSAVTSAFVRSGFFLARAADLAPPNWANPTGYFENLRIYRVNERVLEALDGSWFAPPSHARQRAATRWAVPTLRAELDRVVREAVERPVVLKDPRIGVMLPLWGEILAERFQPILVVRHPLEIARSLHTRDGTTLDDAVSSWLAHMRDVIDHFAGRDVIVVPHAQLMVDTSLATSIVRAAQERLEPDRARFVTPGDAAAALDPKLHHNRLADSQPVDLTEEQAKLWSWLSSLEAGPQPLRPTPGLRELRTTNSSRPACAVPSAISATASGCSGTESSSV